MFEDNNQVIERSGTGVRKYQESNVFKTEQTSNTEEKRQFADYSDQESNSQNIGSQQTKKQISSTYRNVGAFYMSRE